MMRHQQRRGDRNAGALWLRQASFLLKAFVSWANLRIAIRMVRLFCPNACPFNSNHVQPTESPEPLMAHQVVPRLVSVWS